MNFIIYRCAIVIDDMFSCQSYQINHLFSCMNFSMHRYVIVIYVCYRKYIVIDMHTLSAIYAIKAPLHIPARAHAFNFTYRFDSIDQRRPSTVQSIVANSSIKLECLLGLAGGWGPVRGSGLALARRNVLAIKMNSRWQP